MGTTRVRWLLDSVILIDHFNGIDAATRFIASEHEDIALSPITRAEVFTGFDEDELPPARGLLDRFPTLSVTATEADLATSLRRSEGWRLPDALQAALARTNGLRLVTRNTKDFSPDRHRFVEVPYTLSPLGLPAMPDCGTRNASAPGRSAARQATRSGRDPGELAGSGPDRETPVRAAELDPDPVVEAYKRHIDRSLLRQNLKRSIEERVANLIALQGLAAEARRAGQAPGKHR